MSLNKKKQPHINEAEAYIYDEINSLMINKSRQTNSLD